MKKALKFFLRDESGATAIEYGLLAGLISVAIIGTVQTLGTKINAQFSNVAAKLN
jgi:pilus assembly protein Flp/PilA